MHDHTSDREKLFNSATYDLQVTGNLEKLQETCELWVKTYPREVIPRSLLGAFSYPAFAKFEKGVEIARQTMSLDPGFPIGYLQFAFNSQFLGRLDDAESALRQAADRKMEIGDILQQEYDLAYLRGNTARMDQIIARSQGQAGAEDEITARKGFAAAVLKLNRERDTEYGAGFALALAGNSSASLELITDLERRFPEDTCARLLYAPILRALVALNNADPMKAIELLQITEPYDFGTPLSVAPGFFGALYSVYVRGLAYLKAGQGAAAAAEFEKILNHRNIVVSDPIGALAHLQIGRAFALSGDKTKAKAALQHFLVLWKDADSNIPVLVQARKEYADL